MTEKIGFLGGGAAPFAKVGGNLEDDELIECLDYEMGIWREDKPYVASGSRPLWSEVEAGVYAHFYSSGAKLPTGTYRCVARHGQGVCLQKIDSKSDEVMLLPDPIAASLIQDAQRFWAAGGSFRKLGFLHKRGFLLMGPAGCGKTSIINQVAEYVLRELDGLVLLVTEPSQAETVLSNLRRVEPERPVLAVIEDIDSMLSDGREERLLSLLDGKTQIDHVLFVATTNYPERLDQRVRARPSRFDRVEVIEAPSAEVRRAYLTERLPDLSADEVDNWIALSDGFSIAHLKELVLAVRCLGVDLNKAAERIKAGLTARQSSESFRRAQVGFGGRRR